MTEVVVDNGKAFVSEESATIATEAAAQAKQWAEESETQANSATNSANIAYQARNEAVNAVNGFTQRVTEATNTFNSNATAKTNAFNSNATSKTNDFNTNATNKTTAFNNNASSKTTDFNDNASSKTTDFNDNATVKTTAFNDNYTEKKALIDAQVANANNYKNKAREWAISQNVVDNEDYSSKYWAGKSKEWAESVSSPVNKNLSNLNPQGQNIANWSTNVTNCITEIPQDIKLELNNGTLTLKAGSKVYVPNGVGVFDVVTLTADKTSTQLSNDTRLYFYNGSYIEKFPVTQCYSGSTAPSGQTYMFWYDTTNNVVKRTTNSGSTWESGWSLPFCIATASSGALTSIDQVFNGFGYIGSTVFYLPGVKGLIPNGRNADGSLKNIEWVTTYVLTNQVSPNCIIGMRGNAIGSTDAYKYDEQKNQNLNNDLFWNVTTIGKSLRDGMIMLNKNVFHALDYNDSSTISGWAMPSSRYVDLTLGASGATYTAPANGYFCLDKAGTQNEYIDIRNNTTGLLRSKTTISAPGTESIAVYMPCKKGDEIAVVYTATGTTNRFRFIYAEGENV